MDDSSHQQIVQIQDMTNKNVRTLLDSWQYCFGAKMTMENLRKLEEHVNNFYGDLIEETLNKRKYIEEAIAELRQEIDRLRSQLKVDVQLPADADDMPLIFLQSELDKCVEELREQMRQRREQIEGLRREQETLCEQLGEPPRELLSDPLPSEAELDEFCRHLRDLNELRISRRQKVAALRQQIVELQRVLELTTPGTDAEQRLLSAEDLPLTRENLAGLQALRDNYGRQVEELHRRIDEMRAKLETLWTRLETSPGVRDKFQRYTDYSQLVFDRLYAEVQRCEVLRSQNLKKFVQQIRQEITEWWDRTAKSATERQRFTHYYSRNYTDDLLVLHELELQDLQRHYEANEPIFRLYEERKVLWDRMEALEAKANEPGRFNNRGGQLLKEEKERKTIAIKLPKVEQQIAALVQQYEEREHQPFLMWGENIITLMAGEWERKRSAKEKPSQARKPPANTIRTPNGSRNVSSNSSNNNISSSTHTMMRTPLSLKNAAGGSFRQPPPNNTTKLMPATSSPKRKAGLPVVGHPPSMRRVLMPAATNATAVFRLPTVAVTTATPPRQTSVSKVAKTRAANLKKRRRSIVHSRSVKKRLSQSWSTASRERCRNISQLSADDWSQTSAHNSRMTSASSICAGDPPSTHDESTNTPYDYFRKFISPESRSSMIGQSASSTLYKSMLTDEDRRHRQQVTLLLDLVDEDARLRTLPNPRLARQPDKHSSARIN